MPAKGSDRTPDDSGPTWTSLHLWQIQPVRDVLVGLGIFGLLVLGDRISIVTVPLLLAILFAYLLDPLVDRLTRVQWVSRGLAVGGVIAGGALLIGVPTLLGTGFAIVQGARLARNVAEETSAVVASVDAPDDAELAAQVGGGGWRRIRDLVVEVRAEAAVEDAAERGDPVQPRTGNRTSAFGVLDVDARDIANAIDYAIHWLRINADNLGKQAVSTGAGAVSVAVATVGSFGIFLFQLFLTFFFLFFVATGWDRVVLFGRGLLPVKNRVRVVAIVQRMDRAIAGFIRGRLTIAFILAIFYSVGFWLIGVPAPLVTGPAIALLALVPYAPVAGIPVVVFLLWLEGNTGFRGELWWCLLAPILYYNVGQALDDYVLTPVIQGKSADLDTPTILFASIAGGALMGFYGLLIAIPLAACLKILAKEVFWPRFRAWSEGKEKDFLPIDRS